MITTLDLTTIVASTGTTGGTLMFGEGITTGGTTIITAFTILILGIIAYLFDQKFNLDQNQDQEILDQESERSNKE